MRIVRFQAENVKRLQTVEIKPNGNVIEISGKNGNGKSSVLDCIEYALGSAAVLPSKPIRTGKDKASIMLDLGEMIVTRKFTTSGTTLVIEAKNGARFPKPQSMLDQIVGAISFDPLEFTRQKAAEQLKTLRGLVKIEADLDALDGLNAKDYDKRTEVNREAKAFRARADAIFGGGDLPEERIDVEALVESLETAGQANTLLEKRRQGRLAVEGAIAAETNRAAEHRSRAADLRAEADKLDAAAVLCDEACAADRKRLDDAEPLGEPVDTTAIREQIEKATKTNREIEQRDAKRNHIADAEKAEAEAKALTETMDARTALKTKAIAEAKMPVEGLSLGDGMVLFNDLPLEQASSADQLRVSIAIAISMNPKLRVLRIKDGGLLDEDSMAMIEKMAADGDYQFWVESVLPHGNMAIIMEDGQIKGAVEEAPADHEHPQDPVDKALGVPPIDPPPGNLI